MVRGGTPIQSHELEDIRMNREIIILVRGGLPPPMNWKTYEWIGFQFFSEDIRMNWKTYECIGIHTMNWGSAFFWGGRLTNELEDIRMNWGSDFFWGRRHTNELEDIRMNWKTYEWIRVQTFFFGRHSFVSKGNHSYVGLLFFFFPF